MIDIFPIPQETTYKTINIVSEDSESDIYFHITFSIKSNDCFNPMISLSMEEIDFAESHEYLTVFDNTNKMIKECRGRYDANCNKWIQCLNEYKLGVDSIQNGTSYNVSILQPYGIDSFCAESHSYSMNLQITFTCSGTSPAPTVAPTAVFFTQVPSQATQVPSPETQKSQTPTMSPTLSIDDYPTDFEVDAYASSMHYWYQGEQYNGRRLYRGDGHSESDPRVIYWYYGSWLITKYKEVKSGFASCTSYNIFECEWMRYSVYGNNSDDLYVVNGEYNGRWLFEAIKLDRYIYYDLNKTSWKVTDKSWKIIYASCQNQNIFQCGSMKNDGFQLSSSSAPTPLPSPNPTKSPTNPPTSAPTTSPSQSPTTPPTSAPSTSPTQAPTRYPTFENVYDSYIDVVYVIKTESDEIIEYMVSDIIVIMPKVCELIEQGYIDNQDIDLNYFEFSVKILDINTKTIKELSETNNLYGLMAYWAGDQGLKLQSNIECERSICGRILKLFRQQQFEQTVTFILTQYFESYISNQISTDAVDDQDSLHLTFSVDSMGAEVMTLYQEIESNTPYIFYGLLGITGLITLIGVFAVIYNKNSETLSKLPGFNVVDDGKWAAIVVLALQFWDFTSDLNLAYEIATRDDVIEDPIITVIAIGSVLFILLPYIANLWIAARIKKIIKGNETAKSWFQEFTSVFTLLVVLTGGCYPALAVVSSNAFGLKLFSCGLTQFELKKLSKIKIIGTIILENVPQLILQLTYSSHIGIITQAVQWAFIASLLSITASTLSYLIDRDGDELRPVQYYLSMQCQRIDDRLEKDVDDHLDTDRALTVRTYGRNLDLQQLTQTRSLSSEQGRSNHLTKQENFNILRNRGRTQALGHSLAKLFQIQHKNIEIGSTLIHTTGTITHVVHMLYQTEIDIMEEELMKTGDQIKVSPHFYTQQLFESLQIEINDLFRDHFNLSEDFTVTYSDFAGVKSRKMNKAPTMTGGESLRVDGKSKLLPKNDYKNKIEFT